MTIVNGIFFIELTFLSKNKNKNQSMYSNWAPHQWDNEIVGQRRDPEVYEKRNSDIMRNWN